MERSRIAILCNFPIWIVNTAYPRFSGHYATWLPSLYESFKNNQDFEIHWIILSKATNNELNFSKGDQYFHVIPRAKKTIGLFSFYAWDRFKIKKKLKEITPDLVHTWGTEDCYGLCGADFKGSWLHTVQGILTACKRVAKLPRFERYQAFYEKIVISKCINITTESPWAASQIQKINPNINPIQWDYAVEDIFFHTEKILSEEPLCIFCGSDTTVKNVDVLIAAFSRKELSHIKLLLIGVSPIKRANLPNNISALDRISRKEVAEIMAKAWCLIHPSKADTGPTVVKEARVMGLPVIVSKECGAKQYIVHGYSGFVINPDDVEKLTEYVLHISQSQEKASQMGNYGRQQCRDMLSSETMHGRLKSIYNQIIHKH